MIIPRLPSIGRIVIYRSRTGKYDVPAMINCTVDSIAPDGVAGGYIPKLSSDLHVHLTVFTPGIPGGNSGDPFINPTTAETASGEKLGRSQNFSGCYQEWDVPFTGAWGSWEEVVPGSWRWPEVV